MIFRDLSNISFISGNHRIYEIVQQGFYELRIDLEDFNNERRYAIYKRFYIGDESSGYRLNVEDYTGYIKSQNERFFNFTIEFISSFHFSTQVEMLT